MIFYVQRRDFKRVLSTKSSSSDGNYSIQKLMSLFFVSSYVGVHGGAVGSGTALQVERSRVRFPTMSLEFFIDIILPVALWPWG